MKKLLIISILLILSSHKAFANDGFSISIILGNGYSNFVAPETEYPDDLSDLPDKTYLYSPAEIEKKSQWDNTAIGVLYRSERHAFEIESFGAAVEVDYRYYATGGSSGQDGTFTYSFSGIGLSYLYYPRAFAGPNSLQPYIRVGRSTYTYEITDSIDSNNNDSLDASGQIIGGGVEFYLNNAMSIIAGIRFYTTHLGEDFFFNDFGIRVSF
ncbi:MAG: porin family protein [Alphaproteobacteria bacterium]|nr:porin family protein [Alphaproteobacteria bacterium]